MATKRKTNKDPEYKQDIVVQLAAFALFGFLASTGVVDITTINLSSVFGVLILAIAAGVPSDVWVAILDRILRRGK